MLLAQQQRAAQALQLALVVALAVLLAQQQRAAQALQLALVALAELQAQQQQAALALLLLVVAARLVLACSLALVCPSLNRQAEALAAEELSAAQRLAPQEPQAPSSAAQSPVLQDCPLPCACVSMWF